MWVSEQVTGLRAMLDVRAGSLGLPGVEGSLLSRGPENGLTSGDGRKGFSGSLHSISKAGNVPGHLLGEK